MTFRNASPRLWAAVLAASLVLPSSSFASQDERVAEVANLRFHSGFWMNLHHTLYAAAWAGRPEAGTLRALAGRLPAPLDAPLTPQERDAWAGAVEYYDREVASRDLLFGRGMEARKAALVAGDLSRDAIGADLRAVLESAAPVYRRHFWPSHDRANRAWIASAAERVRTAGSDVIARLEKLYGVPWFTSPVQIDVVWVGNRQGAYATNGPPPHVTIASGDPDIAGWTSVEIVFHEVSHVLIVPIQAALERALGSRAREHRVLWHVVQFYLTGAAVQRVLAARGITYEPYLYSSGLFDRAWSRYREAVESSWQPYVEGAITRDEAIAATAGAIAEKVQRVASGEPGGGTGRIGDPRKKGSGEAGGRSGSPSPDVRSRL